MFGTFEGDEGEWMFFLNNRAFGWHNLKVLVDVVFQLVICCIGRKILHEQLFVALDRLSCWLLLRLRTK